MSGNMVHITEKSLEKALNYIDSLATYQPFQREVSKKLLAILCGQDEKIYRPGDIVYISGPEITLNADRQHLMCITGETANYRCIRFCSLGTGRRAGNGSYNKPYQLSYENIGLTATQIENYLGHGYKVSELV